MKATIIIFIMLSLFALIFATDSVYFLVKFDRSPIMKTLNTSQQLQDIKKLSAKIDILYYNQSAILAKADSKYLSLLPYDSYSIIATYPLTGNWFLLTIQPNRDNRITNNMGKEMTRMDQTILLKTELTNQQLADQTTMPFVALNDTPLQITDTQLRSHNSHTRIDYGDLLNQVNADSITWFMQHLQNFGTRNAYATNRLAVANWIKDQFIRLGFSNAHLEPFTILGTDQYNVVATLPGTIAPENYVVIGGHHDSIVLDGNDPLITAPGADDNASGASAVLEMARIMKGNNYQPECSIRFITFACEEYGLYGSAYNALTSFQQNQRIKLMINHDMISNCNQTPDNWNLNLNIYGNAVDYAILAYDVSEAQTSLTPVFWYYNSAGSDSYSYFSQGYPAVYFDEHDFSENYHSINDLVINTEPFFAREVIKASTAMAITADQIPSPVADTWIVETGTGNSLQVNWTALGLEPDVVSYKVYVQLQSQSEPISYPTTSTSFIINDLVADSTYYIGVAALDNDGNEGMVHYITGVPGSMPHTPAGLSDTPELHRVVLNWIANTELDITGYWIYRSTFPDGPFTVLNSTLHTTNSYEDSAINDITYYYYKITAMDADNNESPPTDIIRSRGLSFNQGILIVDETSNNTSNTVFAPNDVTSDAFFERVLDVYNPAQFDIETEPNLKLADIGIYSSIFWHGNDYGNMTYPLLVRDELKKYIQAGGNVLISSYKPTQAFDNNNVYPCTFGLDDFLVDGLGIGSADYNNQARFKYALPQTSGFPPLTVDTLKTLSALHGHIFNIESIGASASSQNIYFYGSDYANTVSQGCMNDLPVGVYSQFNNGAKIVALSFPLYNMYENQVQTFMNYVFHDLFNESVGIEDPVSEPSTQLAFSNLYPNPFSSSTHLKLSGAKQSLPLNVSIYNVKGQKVRTIFSGNIKSSNSFWDWDGRDEQGNAASNAVYFVKATQGTESVSRKLIKLY